jgi:5-methylcytosine-specific restriction endonuclease McrA
MRPSLGSSCSGLWRSSPSRDEWGTGLRLSAEEWAKEQQYLDHSPWWNERWRMEQEQARVLREEALRAKDSGIDFEFPRSPSFREPTHEGEVRHWPKLPREEALRRYEEEQERKHRASVERERARGSRLSARQRGANGASRNGPHELLERSGGRCYICGDELTVHGMHIEHVIPIARGGLHVDENLAAACGSCNSQKSDKFIAFDVKTRRARFFLR